MTLCIGRTCLLPRYVLVTLMLFTPLCNDRNADGADSEVTPERRVLETVLARRGVLVERLESAGTIAGIDEVYVVAKTEGMIEKVYFELGDLVDDGAILVTIDNQSAAYSLRDAREQVRVARLNYEAIQRLYEQQAASRAERAEARSRLERALAQLAAAREAYANTRIAAPLSGYIATKEPIVVPGNYLTPGTRIAWIVDVSRVKVEVALGQREVALVDTGATARIAPHAGCPTDSQLVGTVAAIAAGADPATGSFTTVITADNPCGIGLKAGMTATVVIETSLTDSTVIVPTSAFADSATLFVFDSVRVQARSVTRGETVGNRTEVLEGLAAGEAVVARPPSTLESGQQADTVILGDSDVWQ